MHYKAISSPYWKLKPEYEGCDLPPRVSYYGSMPSPVEAYEVAYRPSIEINDRGRITFSNYFYGKVVETREEAETVAAKLNARDSA